MEVLTRLKRFLSYLRGRGGFNTMDVTAALAITATLAAVVIPSVKGSMDNARVNSLMQEVTNIRNGLLKFNSDTNQMPAIVSVSDVGDINGNANQSSGLRVNGKPIITWQGPYMDKDIGKNPFGGDYKLDYADETLYDVSGLLPPVIVVETDATTGAVTTTTTAVANRDSAVFLVTALPPGVIEKVDSALDDGDPDTGIIQDASTTSTNQLAVIILPGVKITDLTGLVQ
jgi:type II secretory pathway pseudopilin PulG